MIKTVKMKKAPAVENNWLEVLSEIGRAVSLAIAWWLPLWLLYIAPPAMFWFQQRPDKPFPWMYYMKMAAITAPAIVWIIAFWP